MINFVLQFILAAFETILLFLYLNTLLISNSERKQRTYLLFGCYFIFQCFTYFIDFAFFSTSIYYIIFTLFIAWFGYLDEIRIKLMTSGMFVTLNYACKLLAVTSLSSYYHQILPTNPFEYVLNEQMQAFACTLLLIVLLTIIWMRHLKSELSKIIIDIIIFIVPLANLFISMHLLEDKGNIYNQITVLLFSYTFLLFFIIDQIVFSSNAKQISDAMEQRLRLQQIYYHDIQEYADKMSRFRHDAKNHYSTISYLLANDQIELAQKYLDEYTQQMINVKPIINTGNNVVDVILNSKMNIAKQHNIELDHDIVIPPEFTLTIVDISVILANLLDNAIEATAKLSKGKTISLKMQLYKDSLFINISNPYDGKIITATHGFISTKNDRQDHGLGLGNVENIVKKNKGTIDIDYDNDTFNVAILIPNVI
ncbi:MAG: GHKL domain-containing protein [Erysipelotrichaceae bacterium]|nr:GHKL domain-containing protein [Erysipelotrichaceae bacterium]MDY5252871.1 GHKL domain-containing protein [Erysipelotrichaceae bacterium]